MVTVDGLIAPGVNYKPTPRGLGSFRCHRRRLFILETIDERPLQLALTDSD